MNNNYIRKYYNKYFKLDEIAFIFISTDLYFMHIRKIIFSNNFLKRYNYWM